MLTKRTRSQLYFHALALIAVALVNFVWGGRVWLYWGVASSAAATFLGPSLGRLYANTSDTGKLVACAAAIVGCAALIGAYLKMFVRLTAPPSATYWLMVAVILFFPAAMLFMAFAEAWRVMRSRSTTRNAVDNGGHRDCS